MLRHSLIVAALCLVSSTVVGQTEAERRRALLPYVRAATDCTARSIANSEAAKRFAAAGRWSLAINSVVEICLPQYLQLMSSHDRIYGSGGVDFFAGPYLNDLPRALSTRLVPACPADQNVRWHNCRGTGTTPDGARYVGEFRDGKFHGQGTHTWPDGQKYVGEFRDDWPNGQGTLTWPNGEKHAGEFRNGKFHGQGTRTSPDGARYVGEYRDGKRNGQGTYTFPNGEKYVGEFRDEKAHGQGTHTSPDGRRYVGEWRDNKRNGQGTFTWPNGEKYVGEYRDDKRNGQGILYSASGSVLQIGIWSNGEFVRAATPPAPIVQPTPAPSMPSSAQGSVARLGYNQAGEVIVRVSGALTRDALGQFQQAIGDEQRVVVVLEGPGGNLSTGIEIGNRIRLRGYRTAVAPGTVCASACAIAWLGGARRHLDPSSRVGFHAAYIDENGRQMESGVGNALVGSYANRLGLTDSAVIFITSAGPQEMNWVQTGSMNAYGVEFSTDAARHIALR
jgi:hypothetical protein